LHKSYYFLASQQRNTNTGRAFKYLNSKFVT